MSETTDPGSIASFIDAQAVKETAPPPQAEPVDRVNPEESVSAPPPERSSHPLATLPSVAKIDEALTQTKGNRAEAAALLDMTFAQLKNKIWYTPSLRNKWKGQAKVPFGARKRFERAVVKAISVDTPATVMTEANPNKMSVTPAEVVQNKVDQSNIKLRFALSKLGLNRKELLDAMASEQLQINHYASSVDICAAHTTINSIKIQGMLRLMEGPLTNILKLTNPERKMGESDEDYLSRCVEGMTKQINVSDHLKSLMVSYKDLLKESRETAEMVMHGSVIKARLNEMAKRANVGGTTGPGRPKNNQPGFTPKGKRIDGPTQVTQIVTDNVTINNPPSTQPVAAPAA